MYRSQRTHAPQQVDQEEPPQGVQGYLHFVCTASTANFFVAAEQRKNGPNTKRIVRASVAT